MLTPHAFAGNPKLLTNYPSEYPLPLRPSLRNRKQDTARKNECKRRGLYACKPCHKPLDCKAARRRHDESERHLATAPKWWRRFDPQNQPSTSATVAYTAPGPGMYTRTSENLHGRRNAGRLPRDFESKDRYAIRRRHQRVYIPIELIK